MGVRRLATFAVVGMGVVVLAVILARAVMNNLATRQLSRQDEHSLLASNAVLYDLCHGPRPPRGGASRADRAVRTLIRFGRDQPRRRTEVEDSAYVTPWEVLTNTARSMDGTCRRPPPGADKLRVEAIRLTANRSGYPRGALTPATVTERLERLGTTHLHRVAGPPGVQALTGEVIRARGVQLRLAVVLGPDAVTKLRAYRRRLIPGIDNRTAQHPTDGRDTAILLDSKGLAGAPYTENLSTRISDRPLRQRRGDLRNRIEWDLVGEVAP